MKTSTIFKKPTYQTPLVTVAKKKEIPEGLCTKCSSCGEMIFNQQLEENFFVCPKCDYHFAMDPYLRLESLLDPGTFEQCDSNLRAANALEFPNYSERLDAEWKKGRRSDSVIAGVGMLENQEVSVDVMDFSFLGGSMGVVAGEKLTRAVERGLEKKVPVIIFSCSGGARMHEGCFSLMQMAKVSGALLRLSQAQLPYISVLLNPTTGGVTASYATLGDLIISEPGAMIGFAGPRVIKETTRQDLPKGFQTAEFLLAHGLVDKIVPRKQMRSMLAKFLRYFLVHA
ncbi:MAG: acetyl-CoA carboxylase, carboxyltransferase subunit beta [Verrucomicrobiia bacterium]